MCGYKGHSYTYICNPSVHSRALCQHEPVTVQSLLFRNLIRLFINDDVINPMRGSRGGDRGSRSPLESHKNIGFLINTVPDPLKNHKATKPAFNLGPSPACQRNAILMAFCWWASDVPLFVVFGSFLPSSTKKRQS